jgi:hypothetical protein
MGLIKTAAKVAVASSVHGRVQRRQQQRWAEQDLQAAPVAASAAAPTSGAPDLETQLALIAQLNELRQAGALTDAEFDAKKAQILSI